MKKIQFILLAFLAIFFDSSAQTNLICNGSFEEFNQENGI